MLINRDEVIRGLTLRYLQVISDRMTTLDLVDLFEKKQEFKDLFTAKSPLLRQQLYEFSMKLYDVHEHSGEEV